MLIQNPDVLPSYQLFQVTTSIASEATTSRYIMMQILQM